MTLAHPAAVLPLRWTRLPVAAMVIGSLVPDLPVLVGSLDGYRISHTWRGIFTLDIVVGLALLAAWTFLVRDALVDVAPERVRSRFPPRARLSVRDWALAAPAVLVGVLTHVLWDSFTHRWPVEAFWEIGWLLDSYTVAGVSLPGYGWAQYASGAIGLVIVLGAVLWSWWRRPPFTGARPPRRMPAWTLPVVAFVVGLGAVGFAGAQADVGVVVFAFRAVLAVMVLGLLAGVLLPAAWHVAGMGRREDLSATLR